MEMEQTTRDEFYAVWDALHDLKENVAYMAKLMSAQMGSDIKLPHPMHGWDLAEKN